MLTTGSLCGLNDQLAMQATARDVLDKACRGSSRDSGTLVAQLYRRDHCTRGQEIVKAARPKILLMYHLLYDAEFP